MCLFIFTFIKSIYETLWRRSRFNVCRVIIICGGGPGLKSVELLLFLVEEAQVGYQLNLVGEDQLNNELNLVGEAQVGYELNLGGSSPGRS